MSNKKSFVLYHNTRAIFEALCGENCKKLIVALFDYSENGNMPDFEGELKMAFSIIIRIIQRKGV